MRAQWDSAVNRVWSAILTIAGSVLVATLIIVAGVFLKWLLGLSIGLDTKLYSLAAYALDGTCIPCAVIWAVNGVVIVAWEAFGSIRSLFQPTGEQQ